MSRNLSPRNKIGIYIEAAFYTLAQMTHKQFSSKGGKTMTEKRKAALAQSIVKARAALAAKRKEAK